MLSSTIDITMYNGMGVHSTAIDLPLDSLGFVGFVDYPTTGSAYLDNNDPTQVIYQSAGVVGADSFEFTYLDALGANQSYFVNVTTVADPMIGPPSGGGTGSGSGSGGYSGSTGSSSGSTSPGAVSPTEVDPVFWTTGLDGKWCGNRGQPGASWLVL